MTTVSSAEGLGGSTPKRKSKFLIIGGVPSNRMHLRSAKKDMCDFKHISGHVVGLQAHGNRVQGDKE